MVVPPNPRSNILTTTHIYIYIYFFHVVPMNGMFFWTRPNPKTSEVFERCLEEVSQRTGRKVLSTFWDAVESGHVQRVLHVLCICCHLKWNQWNPLFVASSQPVTFRWWNGRLSRCLAQANRVDLVRRKAMSHMMRLSVLLATIPTPNRGSSRLIWKATRRSLIP